MNVEYSVDSNIKTKLLRTRRQNSGVRTIKFNLYKPWNEVGGRESSYEIKEGSKGECSLILEDYEDENESLISSRVSQDGDCKSFTCNMIQECFLGKGVECEEEYDGKIQQCLKKLFSSIQY